MERDAILTCDQKPTWVRLIYSTETITNSGEQEDYKVKTDMLRWLDTKAVMLLVIVSYKMEKQHV